MTLIKRWSGNGITTGGVFTTGSAGTGDTPASALVGTGQSVSMLGPRAPQIGITQQAASASAATWVFPAQASGAFRFYWTSPDAWPANSFQVARLKSGTVQVLTLNQMITGNFRLLGPNGLDLVAGTGNGTMALATRYRIEGQIVHAGLDGEVTVRVYLGESTTASWTLTATANFGDTHNTFQIGNDSTTPTVGATLYDDIVVSDVATLIGPAVSSGAAPTFAGSGNLVASTTGTRMTSPAFTGGGDLAAIRVTGALVKKWSGDGLSAGALTTSSAGTGDNAPSGLSGTGQTVAATGVRPPQIQLTQVASTGCAVNWTVPSQAQGSFRFYWTSPSAWPANSFQIMRLKLSGTTVLTLNTTIFGVFRVLAVAGVEAASTLGQTIALATRYRIEGTVVHKAASVGEVEVRGFIGDAGSPAFTLSAVADFGLAHDLFQIGNDATTPTVGTVSYDDIAVSSVPAFIGSAGVESLAAFSGGGRLVASGPTVPGGNIIRRWSGDNLANAPLTTSTAGTGDTAPSTLGGTGGQSVLEGGVRSPRIRLTQPAGSACTVAWAFPSQTQGAFRFYVTTPTEWPASGWPLFKIKSGTGAILTGTLAITGHLRLYRGGGVMVAASAGSAIALATRYRIEGTLLHNGVNGQVDVRVYLGENTTPEFTLAATADYGTSHDSLMIGNDDATNTVGSLYYDDVAVARTADFIGPYSSGTSLNAPVASGGIDQTVVAATRVALSGTGTDADGTVTSLTWSQVGGPPVTLDQAGGGGGGGGAATGIGANVVLLGDPDTTNTLNENSGLAVSRKNSTLTSRVFYGMNDSGGTATIYAIDDLAGSNVIATMTIVGGINGDMEDISVGPGPDPAKSYIYVGSIGSAAATKRIYRVEEPTIVAGQAHVASDLTPDIFRYTGGPDPDCEAMAVDPVTSNVFLVSKKSGSSVRPQVAQLWRITGSQLGTITADERTAGGRVVTPTLIGDVEAIRDQALTQNGGITAMDISANGRYITICNYQEIWVWTRDVTNGQTVGEAMTGNPTGDVHRAFVSVAATPTTPAISSAWGTEAIAFDIGDKPGFLYTLPETGQLKRVALTYAPDAVGGTPGQAAFSAPFLRGRQALTFRLTALDNSGRTGTDDVIVNVKGHTYWYLDDLLWRPLRGRTVVFDPVQNTLPTVALTATVASGQITVSWVVTPGTGTVDGVYAGHTGPNPAPFEGNLRAGITGSQTFTGLTNGTTYSAYVDVVVEGNRVVRATVDATPAGSVAPIRTTRLLGIYNDGAGAGADAATLAAFGLYPDIASEYVQRDFAGWNGPMYNARVDRGIHMLITITTKPTQYLYDIVTPGAVGSAQRALYETARTWLQEYVDRLHTLSQRNLGVTIYATLEHEHDVKVQPANSVITGNSADPGVYGRALGAFRDLCRARAPRVKVGYWYGGFQEAHIQQVWAAIPSTNNATLDWVAADQYVNGTTYESMLASFTPEVNRIRTGLYSTDWVRLGRPKVGMGEYGISKWDPSPAPGSAVHSDTAMARYHNGEYNTDGSPKGARSVLAALDLEFALLFNRESGPNGWQLITDGEHPLAVKAYADSLTG